MTQTRTEVRSLLARHDLRPRKRLGQHFLADPNIVDKIVRLAGDPTGRHALEIGAGTGTLTLALAGAGFEVTSYEVDQSLRPLLEEVLEGAAVDLRLEDASTLDMAALDGSWVMVANLPYHVGTPILLDSLRRAAAIGRWVVMVQREVADRLSAAVGDGEYGLPSVVCAIYGEAKLEFTVPPQVFVPPPNVDSAVVVIDRVHVPDRRRERAIELAAAAFNQRRKMIRSSLKALVADPVPTIVAAGLDPTSRAENLSAEDYLRLAAGVGE